MQSIQLYIEGQRVELFKDESVTITQSIQNAKDIGKVFTDFTKTFSVPATKINNKIFKHYYNFDIVGGFDARIKKPAIIELNNLQFREGKIKLEGVDLKNNKADVYKITFFGSTVELKDLFGEDKLQSLNELTAYNKIYNSTNVRTSLQSSSLTDVIVPLITHTERLFYDSSSTESETGNLHYDSKSISGVRYDELKYAIRIDTIIRAIESRYNITFSTDFFNDTNLSYYNLYLWLHRKKGAVENLTGINQSAVYGFIADYDIGTFTQIDLNSALTITGQEDKYLTSELTFETSNTNSYFISLQRNGIEYLRQEVSGGGNVTINNFPLNGTYTIYIEADVQIVFSDIFWFFRYEDTFNNVINEKTHSTNTYVFENTFTFDITQQIPDIKVLDFLSGLFKTFNLTAYLENDIIVVKTLDDFYSVGIDYDITKYIDVKKSSVNVALPYKEISFEHEDTKTFLAAIHKQKFGKTWGKSEYDNGESLDGSKYSIKTPFAQMKYERLVDAGGTDGTTTIQWGYSTDDNQESYIGKPLIFYPFYVGGESLSFVNNSSSVEALPFYIVPSNSVDLSSSVNKDNINFYNEVNEWSGDTSFSGTLFEKYYKKYIQDIFNPKNRLSKFTAYLPLRILINYKLSDRFIINGNRYKINSIKTNLKDGVSQLELLNDYD